MMFGNLGVASRHLFFRSLRATINNDQIMFSKVSIPVLASCDFNMNSCNITIGVSRVRLVRGYTNSQIKGLTGIASLHVPLNQY